MNRKTNRTVLLIVVLIITVLSASLVAAQGVQNNGPGGRQNGPSGRSGGAAPAWMADYVDEFDAAVANLLGISVAELEAGKEAGTRLNELAESAGLDDEAFKAAMDAIHDDILDLAVADGVLSEDEATQIRERDERGGDRGVVAEWAAAYDGDFKAAVANLLGISVAELEVAQEAGTGFNELAESAGLDVEAFKAAMDGIRDDILDLAVADGVLSEDEATQIRERDEQRPGRPDGRRPGGQGGRPGGRGGQGAPSI